MLVIQFGFGMNQVLYQRQNGRLVSPVQNIPKQIIMSLNSKSAQQGNGMNIVTCIFINLF